jgi:hypothetical protein
MRLALRAALGPSLPHRPDGDRMDPDFSARCTILKKAICELCKRRTEQNEGEEWQKAWARGANVLPENIASICARARELLDEAHVGQQVNTSLTSGQMEDQLRSVVLARCSDGICLLDARASSICRGTPYQHAVRSLTFCCRPWYRHSVSSGPRYPCTCTRILSSSWI